jgi:hypothetical protein
MPIVILRCLRWLALPLFATVAVLAFPVSGALQAQGNTSQQQNAGDKPYVIEYYYKAKWGHAEEFIALFKKNHYPVLKKEIELGRILKVFRPSPPLPRHGRRTLGLSHDHRLQERANRQRQLRFLGAIEAALPGSGILQKRRAAAL